MRGGRTKGAEGRHSCPVPSLTARWDGACSLLTVAPNRAPGWRVLAARRPSACPLHALPEPTAPPGAWLLLCPQAADPARELAAPGRGLARGQLARRAEHAAPAALQPARPDENDPFSAPSLFLEFAPEDPLLLRTCSLSHLDVDSSAVAAVARQLQSGRPRVAPRTGINLVGCRFSAGWVGPLARAGGAGLGSLALTDCWPEPGLEAQMFGGASALTSLRRLCITRCNVPPEAWAGLAELPALEDLEVRG